MKVKRVVELRVVYDVPLHGAAHWGDYANSTRRDALRLRHVMRWPARNDNYRLTRGVSFGDA